MKKLLLVSLSAFVGAVLAVVLLGLPLTVRAGGGGVEKCAAKNGDVNADGNVNLSDAITILGHLFLGSPMELVPLCATQGSSGLPDTGETKCYDQAGTEVPCDGATCPGQDGSYATGCPSEGRFADNEDGTVTDNCTGLIWQKDTADVNGDGQIGDFDSGDAVPWCVALSYCENLSFAGFDDWRLPNVRELQSIVDYGRFVPSIDLVFGAEYESYWSSTSRFGNPFAAWLVNFNVGEVDSDNDKSNPFYVRAVRNAP